ncbi:MAG: hypothetical protein NC452_19380 [Eubacterium sp.]|nr:hypothetical protein [Eubacterium sp.]
MKKRIVFAALTILLMIGGCGFTETDIDHTPQPDDLTFIRWGMLSFGSREEKTPFSQLNERLEAEGSNIRIEAVEIDMGYDDNTTFGELIYEYEKENGSFDIVTYGADWVSKIGAANIFFESGYFCELSEEDKSFFTDIPEICWEAGKVNGKLYTVPALNFGFGSDIGLFYYFNTKYISEDKLQSFGCTVSELENILSTVTPNEELTGLDFKLKYLDYTEFTAACEKGGLYFSEKTLKAANPYEVEEVIEYAHALNSIYQKGYINYEINFSDWDDDYYKEYLETEFAVYAGSGRVDEKALSERLGKNGDVLVCTLPYYMENRLFQSTGIPIASAHSHEAMELLKRLHTDKDFSGLLTPEERDAIGLPRSNDESVDIGEVKLSPFAGFQLKYTDIDRELQSMLVSSFDKLCKSDDFYKTLDEINAELKAAGIDEYAAKVNRLLEESFEK